MKTSEMNVLCKQFYYKHRHHETKVKYLCHEVSSHAGLRWYKFLLHDCAVVLKPCSDGAVTDDILYVALSLLASSNLLTALSYSSHHNTPLGVLSLSLSNKHNLSTVK